MQNAITFLQRASIGFKTQIDSLSGNNYHVDHNDAFSISDSLSIHDSCKIPVNIDFIFIDLSVEVSMII